MARLRISPHRTAGALARQCDLLLVFGGDGTMLRVAREVAGCRTPVLGINLGSLGFLTAVPSDELGAVLKEVWANQFTLESRPLIQVTGGPRNEPLDQTALNDFVISRGAGSRMIELEVSVDDQVLTCYRCDGLVVSSPTGSTAYSLSAGGAVVTPNAEVFTITPICPHTLSNRSVVVNLDSVVKVRVVSKWPEIVVAADGQVEIKLAAGDEISIRRSRRVLRLLRPAGNTFFKTLRQKLNWSGSNV
ncbi:MAG: NAD(+)/NADH kinase [Pedosphaera parvula]|nr:NAD(+)/NADH kinase [Pedosphaera parvula]